MKPGGFRVCLLLFFVCLGREVFLERDHTAKHSRDVADETRTIRITIEDLSGKA